MNPFKNWSDADVALHNSRVCPANQIPVPVPVVSECCRGAMQIRSGESGVTAYCLKCGRATLPVTVKPAVEDEGELQSDIRAWCGANSWMCFGGSMAHRTRRTLGEPDMTIVGTVIRDSQYTPLILFIECKSRSGKLRPEQVAVAAGCARHGVTVHVVRSMSDFIALTK